MPKNKQIPWLKLLLGICAVLFLTYATHEYRIHLPAFPEIAYAEDIYPHDGKEACSNHSWWHMIAICRFQQFANLFFVRIPLALIASVFLIPVWLASLMAKLPALILYEIFMTIATIVITICLWLVESSLSPAPGSIAHTFIYQEPIQNLIHASLWMPVRDIVNVGFALVLIAGAIITILKANKEWLQNTAPNLLMMIILVNFSWFFSRVMLDLGNVAAKASMSLASIPPCNDNAWYCKEVKEIIPNPLISLAWEGNQSILFTPPGYRCPLLLICVRIGPQDQNPVDRMTGGLTAGFVSILDAMGGNAGERISNFFGWQNISRFYTLVFTTNQDIFTLILRLAVDLVTDVLMFDAKVFTLTIAAILFLTAIVILFVIFLMRIPVIWLTQGFFPLVTLMPFLPGQLKSIIDEQIWKRFLIAVFLPAVVGLPMAAGFAIMRGAQMIGVGNALDVAAQMPPVAQILFGNLANTTATLLFVVFAIAILWTGVMAAVKSQQLIPQLQAAVAEKIGGFGKAGARYWGEYAAKRMPFLPGRLAPLGIPTLGDAIKRRLAGLAPGAIPPPARPTGGTAGPRPGPGGGIPPLPSGPRPRTPPTMPPTSDKGAARAAAAGQTSPPPIPKKALTPDGMKELVGRTLDIGGVRARVDKVSDDGKTASLTGADGTKYEAPYEKLAGARVLKEKDATTAPSGFADMPLGEPPAPTTGKGMGEEVRKRAREGVIEGMGGKGTPPEAAGEGTVGETAAAGIGETATGGEKAEPTWGQAWEGLKNSKIGTIASNTRSRIMGIPVLGSLLRGTGTLIGGVGNVGKTAIKEAFREKEGGLGSVVTGLQKGMKELGAIARAGNASIAQSISEALKDARRQQHIPKEDVDKFHSAAQTDTNLDRHLNDFLASDTNMEHHLGQILTTLRAMGHAKGSSLSVGEGNLPSLLEELFKKKLETGGRGFTGPGMGGVSTGNDMFRKVLVQLEKVEAERRRRSTPPTPPATTPPPAAPPAP